MNIFEYRIFINEKPYSIYVDSSKDEYKKIIINNTVVVEEKYTLALNKDAYIIYYVILIDGQEVVLSVDDNPLEHKYDIFLDGISLVSGKALDSDYAYAKANLEKGFRNFCRENWRALLKENILSFLLSAIALFALGIWTFDLWFIRILLVLLSVPITLPIFILSEWVYNKNIVRKYPKCFRPKVLFSHKFR